jgi:hypothetical protein
MSGIEGENRDDMIAALLSERDRAVTDEHRAAIDEQLKARGYQSRDDKSAGKAEAKDAEAEKSKAAEERAAAAKDDKTAPPPGRTTVRGKQASA